MASKTRLDIERLINKTAMLQGELERIDQEIVRLAEHRADVEKSRVAYERTLAYVVQQEVGGLPTVYAHRSYGKRGDLQRFLAATLNAAAPAQFMTIEPVERALANFELRASSPAELYYFHNNNTVGRALRRLQALGLVDRLTTKHRVERSGHLALEGGGGDAGAAGTADWRGGTEDVVGGRRQGVRTWL
jgi:hypothetical protein